MPKNIEEKPKPTNEELAKAVIEIRNNVENIKRLLVIYLVIVILSIIVAFISLNR